MGYSVAVFLEYVIAICLGYLVGSLVTLVVTGYFLATALLKDIKDILNSIDANSKTEKNRPKLIEQFSDFIEVHSFAKQLSICCVNYNDTALYWGNLITNFKSCGNLIVSH